ncbi:MAG: NAD(P)H-hydrate epimerase [Candidatus Kariarchaeaceae archaeon]
MRGISTDEMVEVDRIMTEELGIEVELMMEHAGVNLARFCVAKMQEETVFVTVVGSGNNGGGGLTAVRKLIGWKKECLLFIPKGVANLKSIPVKQLQRIRQIQPDIPIFEDLKALKKELHHLKKQGGLKEIILIDALIGYGFKGVVNQETAEILQFIASQEKVICLDVPSGMDTTTGEMAFRIKPKATLTLAFVKKGLIEGKAELGDLYVVDIGVPEVVYAKFFAQEHNKKTIKQLYDSFAKNAICSVQLSQETGTWNITSRSII